jgi:hypothetical protein
MAASGGVSCGAAGVPPRPEAVINPSCGVSGRATPGVSGCVRVCVHQHQGRVGRVWDLRVASGGEGPALLSLSLPAPCGVPGLHRVIIIGSW